MVQAVTFPSSSTSLATYSSIVDFLDRSIRDDLQATAHLYFMGVLFSAFAVVVGVLLEGPEVISEVWPAAMTRLFGTPNKRIVRAIRKAGFIGWIFVAAGVAGEGILEGFQNRTEGQLQTFNDILLADSERHTALAVEEAGDASASANSAAEAASLANRKALGAEGDARNAGVIATSATTTANSATEAANELDKRIAAATTQLTAITNQVQAVENKRDRLEKSIINMAVCSAPRTISNWLITGPNGSSYIDSLRPFATKNAELVFNEADPELKRAASNIESALKDAGWKVVLTPPMQTLFEGVSVQTRNQPPNASESYIDPILAAKAIVRFLHSYNWQAKWEPGFFGDRSFPPNGLRILIGAYPSTQFVTPPAMEAMELKTEEFDRRWEARHGSLPKDYSDDPQPCQPVHLVNATP